MMTARKRLIALSGPSCGGKGPLLAAVAEFHRELDLATFAVIKSTESRGGGPRPDEADIWDDPDYFRPRAELESLTGDRYLHAVSHGFPQVLDLERVVAAPAHLIVLEASQEITRRLPSSDYLRDADVITVFVSPLGGEEIEYLKRCKVEVAEYLKGLGVRRLLARAAFHGRHVDDGFLADVAVRAADAVEELRKAHLFDYVLVSRSGEGSPDWNRDAQGRFLGHPVNEAAATLATFAQLLTGQPSPDLENWRTPPL
jgi:guanylate kinase